MENSHDHRITDIAPSDLSTLEHWEEVYEQELSNLLDHGEDGEIWFGRQCERSVIKWISEHLNPDHEVAILDIGCGNGHFLKNLKSLTNRRLYGLDFSQKAVEMTSLVMEKSGIDALITQADFMNSGSLQHIFPAPIIDYAVDKGTFDAISMQPRTEKYPTVKCLAKVYSESLLNIMKPGSFFIITSCNWTESELIELFDFEVIHRIEYPKFAFGGKNGQSVSTVIFSIRY